jgi:acylphosphatase
MAQICLNVVVSGRVQGVWFRKFTQQKAEAYGVTGWVRNLSNGSVEALLCGDEKNVRQVEAWMSQGPELSTVAELVSELATWQEFSEFLIEEDAPAAS